MSVQNEFTTLIVMIFFLGAVVGFLLVCFDYLSNKMHEYNTMKANELKAKNKSKEINREIINQARKHSIEYSEEIVRQMKEKNKKDLETDIDFKINFGGSIVKTEVVYAE